jgi:hypothetical protein
LQLSAKKQTEIIVGPNLWLPTKIVNPQKIILLRLGGKGFRQKDLTLIFDKHLDFLLQN